MGKPTIRGCPAMERSGTTPRFAQNPVVNDTGLLEALSHFNREKIPERVVHAKGTGAYGEFEVTDDISDICNIDMLLGVGKKTPCVGRFSTTGLERGSAEGIRDVKGLGLKFDTKEGNWDWVCINFPYFFIRDPAKFPDLMHAQQRDPKTNLLNPNMYWDWVADNPESLHLVLTLFSKLGTMFNWRTMSAYLGHAYKWTMPDGSFKYVHVYLSPNGGPSNENASMDDAMDENINDPDGASRDLYEAIERGDFPTWTAYAQVVDPEDAPDLDFNILDMTKHWNYGFYPKNGSVIPKRAFGTLTLNRNPEKYFSEIECLTFSPSNLVPGVLPSEDPILQARMFAYPDAQRYRLGVNPENPPARPKKPLSLKPGSQKFDEWVSQVSSPAWSEAKEDDYEFARELYEWYPQFRDQEFQNELIDNLAESISQTCDAVRQKVYRTFALVSTDLADRVREGVEKRLETATTNSTPQELPGRARL
ncbi:Catalase mono-functional heme-containing [Penicillium expansum]|nr:Catalase mono-functional heme-containing [Penicillium expansum]